MTHNQDNGTGPAPFSVVSKGTSSATSSWSAAVANARSLEPSPSGDFQHSSTRSWSGADARAALATSTNTLDGGPRWEPPSTPRRSRVARCASPSSATTKNSHSPSPWRTSAARPGPRRASASAASGRRGSSFSPFPQVWPVNRSQNRTEPLASASAAAASPGALRAARMLAGMAVRATAVAAFPAASGSWRHTHDRRSPSTYETCTAAASPPAAQTWRPRAPATSASNFAATAHRPALSEQSRYWKPAPAA
mmetsp:Transcript_113728/g.322050  ORF Transcript_113728/g.322050 Transcript_113728/m.322050 type:complete len:252 (-) Transcript_113728:197-952(-)